MIDHLSSYASDYPTSKEFYDAVMKALGQPLQAELVMTWDQDLPGRRAAAWGPDRAIFWLIESIRPIDPRHFAFTASDRAGVDAFHRAALAAGGTEHGEPGLRPIYHADYYGAFVLDPDANNVEAVCHSPA